MAGVNPRKAQGNDRSTQQLSGEVSCGSVFSASFLLSTPGFAVLSVLVLIQSLSWFAGLGSAVLIFCGLYCILYNHFHHVEDLKAFIAALRHSEGQDRAHPLSISSGSLLFPEINPALLRMAQEHWRYRRELELAIEGKEAVLQSLPSPLIMLDCKKKIIRGNSAAEGLLGSNIRGRELSAVLRSPALLSAVEKLDREDIAKAEVVQFTVYGNPEYNFETQVIRLPETTWDGIRIVISLTDQSAVRRANQMRGDFIANASHELKTPLSSLTGFIETLRGPAKGDLEAQERFLGIMQDQALRMSRLVDDLLSLSQIELLEHTRPTGITQLSEIIKNVVESLEIRCKSKEMQILLELDEMAPVKAEPEEMRQVFLNLLDNAIKYGRAGTAIAVRSRLYDVGSHGMRRIGKPSVAVSVIDQGEGIPREHIPRLTERFYRVDTARSRQVGGTGLGLAIVKHILNRHRATLSIDSRVGEGSTFTVYLPQATQEASD